MNFHSADRQTPKALRYSVSRETNPAIGLIVLQADETIERECGEIFSRFDVRTYVSRVPSGAEVTPETLRMMEEELPRSAELLPPSVSFSAVGYGCTSGATHIGSGAVAAAVRRGCRTDHVSDPLRAVIAACRALSVKRLAFLSPYIESVAAPMREALAESGIETTVSGSFNEASEEKVAKICPSSIRDAGRELADGVECDALFMSCTNLPALSVISGLEDDLGVPVLSSNQVLAWHLLRSAGVMHKTDGFGRLYESEA